MKTHYYNNLSTPLKTQQMIMVMHRKTPSSTFPKLLLCLGLISFYVKFAHAGCDHDCQCDYPLQLTTHLRVGHELHLVSFKLNIDKYYWLRYSGPLSSLNTKLLLLVVGLFRLKWYYYEQWPSYVIQKIRVRSFFPWLETYSKLKNLVVFHSA